jgi:hypothetical protein
MNNNTVTLYVTVPSDVYSNNIKNIQEQLGIVMAIADDITTNIFNIYFVGTLYYRIKISAAIAVVRREVLYEYLKQIKNIIEMKIIIECSIAYDMFDANQNKIMTIIGELIIGQHFATIDCRRYKKNKKLKIVINAHGTPDHWFLDKLQELNEFLFLASQKIN